MPVLVLTRFGHHPGIVGLLIASFGVGALVGNAISFRFLTRRFQGLAVIAACALGQAAPLWLLWLPLPAIALSALIFASGIANGLVNPSLHAITTLRIPPPLRPNVLADRDGRLGGRQPARAVHHRARCSTRSGRRRC